MSYVHCCTACGHPIAAHTDELRCLFSTGTLTLRCLHCNGSTTVKRMAYPPQLLVRCASRQGCSCGESGRYYPWPGLSKLPRRMGISN